MGYDAIIVASNIQKEASKIFQIKGAAETFA
jgi:hypothetical protein